MEEYARTWAERAQAEIGASRRFKELLLRLEKAKAHPSILERVQQAEQEEEEREGLISPPVSPSTPKIARKTHQTDSRPPTPQRSFTLRQTLRTPAFYLLCADVVSGCILGAGVFFHLIPVIVENGGVSVDVALSLTLPMVSTLVLCHHYCLF